MSEVIETLPVIILERDIRRLAVVITISGLLALVTALSLLPAPIERESAAPFRESEYGALAAVLNMVLMIALVAGFTVLIAFLIRYRKINVVRALLVAGVSFASGWAASFIVYWWLAIALALLLSALGIDVVAFISAHVLVLRVLFTGVYYAMFIGFMILTALALTNKLSLRARNVVLVLSATWIGAILAFTLGWLTPLILLAAFALYDVYAVYRGPLRMLYEAIPEESLAEFRGLALGAGDLLFYSLAIAYALQVSWVCGVLVLAICVCGNLLTVHLLLTRGERMAPALPLPILGALATILAFSLFG